MEKEQIIKICKEILIENSLDETLIDEFTFVVDKSFQTIGYSSEYAPNTIAYNPDFLSSLSPKFAKDVLQHELLHYRVLKEMVL